MSNRFWGRLRGPFPSNASLGGGSRREAIARFASDTHSRRGLCVKELEQALQEHEEEIARLNAKIAGQKRDIQETERRSGALLDKLQEVCCLHCAKGTEVHGKGEAGRWRRRRGREAGAGGQLRPPLRSAFPRPTILQTLTLVCLDPDIRRAPVRPAPVLHRVDRGVAVATVPEAGAAEAPEAWRSGEALFMYKLYH